MHGTVTVAVAGTVIGVGAALAPSGFLSTLLYGVRPFDPPTYVSVAAGVLPPGRPLSARSGQGRDAAGSLGGAAEGLTAHLPPEGGSHFAIRDPR